MASKKKTEIFVEVHNEKEFENIIRSNAHQLICAEVYSYAFGFCTALDRLFNTIKLDWSDGKIILLKVPSDEIQALQRFRDQSEPVYLFILNMKVTKFFRGVDMVRFAEVAKRELQYYRDEQAGAEVERRLYDLDEPTPEELDQFQYMPDECLMLVLPEVTDFAEVGYVFDASICMYSSNVPMSAHNSSTAQPIKKWMAARLKEKQQELNSLVSRRQARQAIRKRHRAELMVPHLTDLNFVLYWPHCLHAHPELYERWDNNNIVMVAREDVYVTDEIATDIFYEGDAPLNEASLHKLRSGPALALCLRLLDSNATSTFATITRRILYEDIRLAPHDETKPIEGELPMITAFNYYKRYSPTKEEILQQRAVERERKRQEIKENRVRRLSEMQRLAQQAIEEAIAAKRAEREQRKLDLLKTGNLSALDKFNEEPVDDTVDIHVPQELADDEVSIITEDDPDEYFPPPGLLIPGFYAPPNDIAKVNGLAMLFPKLVQERVIPQPECLPPHVLVMLDINKRHKAIDAIAPYTYAILHNKSKLYDVTICLALVHRKKKWTSVQKMGIFKASCPYDSVHIAYTVKQFDTMDNSSWNLDELKIAFMVSIENDIPLLQLVDLTPFHVSRDDAIGEEECAAMFAVDYCDNYDAFEDFFNN